MNNAILLIAFVCLSAFSIAAQQGGPPPAAPDYSPESWKEYSYPDDNLRFRFLVKPMVEETVMEAGGAILQVRSYKSNTFVEFTLYITDQGSQDIESKIRKSHEMLDGMVSSGIGTNHLLKRQQCNIDGHPGMFFSYETPDGKLIRAKMFVIKNKIYSAGTKVKKGEQIGIN